MIDPMIGAGLIRAGGDLIGGFLGASAQESANRTNIQLARENRAWQEDMWNKQNEYNSPAAQIERMRKAGLNPALMYSRGDVGNAGSVGSVATPQVQPVSGMAEGLAESGGSIASAMMQLEQVKQMRAQTKLLTAKAIKEVNTTMTPDQYQDYLLSRIDVFKKQGFMYNAQGHYADSRAAGQDMYNFAMPKLLYNQQRQGELTNQKISQDMMVQLANWYVNSKLATSRMALNSAQANFFARQVKLLDQKYDFLENFNPKQLDLILFKTASIIRSMKHLDWQENFGDNDQMLKYIFKGIDTGIDLFDATMPDGLITP